MTPERWQKVEELFHLSLEQEAGQRAAFLDEACAGNSDLRDKVELLLAYDEQESDFLETPASGVIGDWFDEARGSIWSDPARWLCVGPRHDGRQRQPDREPDDAPAHQAVGQTLDGI